MSETTQGYSHEILDTAPYIALASSVGGKAAQLARLETLGMPVPRFFAVEAAIFCAALDQQVVHTARWRAGELLAQGDSADASALMREAILTLELPDVVARDAAARWRRLGSRSVAVRSSAIGEDGGDLSFAGQFDTVLGVATEAQLLAAIRSCWASAFTERVLAYRERNGLDPLHAEMGVVVQCMVDADVAGVMFTGDPTTGDPYVSVVSATWGLGEALVSGRANADTYRLDRRTGELEVGVADKDVQLVLSPDTLTEEITVSEERRMVPALSEEQVRELVRIGQLLEREQGCAQDVEFAYEDGALHILQTRPVTSGLRPRGVRRVWDNSNIVESYAGVVSPLTFSFAREAYGEVYLQFLRLLRVPQAEMPTATVQVRQLLGYLDGRVYYNLAAWYYLLSVLPGYESNKGAMETMMGVRSGLDQRVAPRASPARKLRVLTTLTWQLLTIRRSIAAFRRHLSLVLGRYDRDLTGLDADQLVEAYDDLRRDLLSRWQTPIVNDFRVMVSFSWLRKAMAQLGLDETGTLQNDLMCGQGDVESAEPTYMLLRMAARIRANEALRSVVVGGSDDELRGMVRLLDTDDARWLDAQFEVYLTRFGDRCANELKLETPTLREHPAFLYSVLRNFVRQEGLSEESLHARERAVVERAEAQVREALLARPFGRFRLRVFTWLLRQARSAVRDREALRFDRTRVFGLARRLFASLGVRLREAGVIADARDVFLLEVDEVVGTVQGTCTTTDLRALVELRRRELQHWEGEPLPDRVETIGITGANPYEDAYAEVDVSGDSLSGIGCCPGTVKQTVRVVHSPNDGVELAGDIMACTRTDPGWVPLFPSCGGLLVERGSLLSHSAIVAREFGIPAIVGIPGLMQWARDGEQVRMDGRSGVVERVDGDGEPPQGAP